MKKAIRKRTRKRAARGSVQTSRTTRSNNGEEVTKEDSKELTEEVADDVGYITVSGGLTKNLGDFNSCKVSVSVTLPFTDEGDASVRKAYKRNTEMVDEFLDSEYKKAMGTEE